MNCFAWINAICEHLVSGSVPETKVCGENYIVQSLPHDIIFEILLRLPAKEILEFRRVCKDWNAFISTSIFTSKHLRNSRPSILIVYMVKRNNIQELCGILFDDCGLATKPSVMAKRKLGPNSICPVRLCYAQYLTCSYSEYPGIFVFTPRKPLYAPRTSKTFSHIFYNPVTRQKLLLNTGPGYICGCFYNSSKGEYQALGIQKKPEWTYMILDLGSPNKDHSRRWLNSFDHLPRGDNRFVQSFRLDKEYLYSMSAMTNHRNQETLCNDAIIMFDMKKEELSTIPHPGSKCTTSRHCHMHILELKDESKVESFLCLCDCTFVDRMDMWVLEDWVNRVWVMRRKIVLNFSVWRSPADCHSKSGIKPFGMINGEMFINMGTLGVYAFNLSKGILRRIIELYDEKTSKNIEDYKIINVSFFYNNLDSFSDFKGLYVNKES